MPDQLTIDYTAEPVKARRAQRMHVNSLEAYRAELPGLHTRALDVLAWLKVRGPATDRQCAAGMGYAHRSMVQPRITELVDRGLLEECGKVRCPETGRMVRQVKVANA